MSSPSPSPGATLFARPLTSQAFARYGEVIDISGLSAQDINAGTAQRFDTRVAIDARDGEPAISIFVGQPHTFPVGLVELERHPLGSQLFMPLDRRPYLVVVAGNASHGEPAEPEAFLASGDQGVNYPAGLWHHPLLALEQTSRFLVVDRRGDGANLDILPLKQQLQVVAKDGPPPVLG